MEYCVFLGASCGSLGNFEAVRTGPSGFSQRVCLKVVLPFFRDRQDFRDLFETQIPVQEEIEEELEEELEEQEEDKPRKMFIFF